MYEQDTDKANQIQSDVLIETTANNPNFQASKISSKNTAFNTDDKRVVGAINELLAAQNKLYESTQATVKEQNDLIGDTTATPELKEKLTAVSTNLIEAVAKCDTNITTIKKAIAKENKQVCFVVPRVNSTTKCPEIYFPFYGTLNRIVASVSSTCANRGDDDAEIPLTLQYQFDNEWRDIATVSIAKDNFYISKNFTDDTLIVDNKPMRVKVGSVPVSGETYDLSVIVFMTVNS